MTRIKNSHYISSFVFALIAIGLLYISNFVIFKPVNGLNYDLNRVIAYIITLVIVIAICLFSGNISKIKFQKNNGG
jgi:hypothetical protein